MKLFSILLMKRTEEQADSLLKAIETSGRLLHNSDKVHLSLERKEGVFEIRVEGVLPQFQLHNDAEPVYKAAAEAIAGFVLSEEERRFVRKLIQQEFEYDHEEDCSKIIGYCEQMLYDVGEGLSPGGAALRRKGKIRAEISEYLRHNTELNLEGFIRFRLQPYLEELREVVEYAVDEFVMDRQHQEFISLLQYFVYIQEAKIPFVHLIHKGGNEFMLLNDRMEMINTEDRDAIVTVEMLEKDMNFEDMIVSTLITVSPQQIYIHTREPELQVIKTIVQIFENRVELCGYCRLCHNLDRTSAAEYNKG